MSPTIHLQKATRIEGNADIEIETAGDRVVAARFMVGDFRGFEAFVKGRRVETAPHLVSRICGLCSVAHQVAGFSGLEDAFAITVPQDARDLRTIAVLGEWTASHAVNCFFMTAPDLLGATGGLFELMRTHPDLASEALALRDEGRRIVELAVGRSVHPVSLRLGGFSEWPSTDRLAGIRDAAVSAHARALALTERAAEMRSGDAGIPFPSDQQINLLVFDTEADAFVTLDATGAETARFERADFADRVSEMRADWSFAKFPYLADLGFPAGIMLVGPLARALRADPGTVLSTRDVDALRLLEIVRSTERVQELVAHLGAPPPVDEFDPRTAGTGVGVVEAPRGTLVHRYEVDDGLVCGLRLLVATQFNNAFINLMLKDIAQANLQNGSLTPEGEKLIGRSLRLFDPCLSCATH